MVNALQHRADRGLVDMHVDLSDPNCEPSDEQLSVIMSEVCEEAVRQADVASSAFWNAYSSGSQWVCSS